MLTQFGVRDQELLSRFFFPNTNPFDADKTDVCYIRTPVCICVSV
jgi:hypothetical protein